VRQRVVPLGVLVERFGGAPIAGGPRSYTLSYQIGGVAVPSGQTVRDAWAPGELFALDDDQKLSRPSFEHLPSGHAGVGALGMTHGVARTGAQADYETRVIDADELPRPAAGYQVPASVEPMLDALHAARDAIGYGGPDLAVSVSHPSYRVADTIGLTSDGGEYESWIEADEARGGRSGHQVVGAHEAT
jgi:hypothetical protein